MAHTGLHPPTKMIFKKYHLKKIYEENFQPVMSQTKRKEKLKGKMDWFDIYIYIYVNGVENHMIASSKKPLIKFNNQVSLNLKKIGTPWFW